MTLLKIILKDTQLRRGELSMSKKKINQAANNEIVHHKRLVEVERKEVLAPKSTTMADSFYCYCSAATYFAVEADRESFLIRRPSVFRLIAADFV